MRSIASRRMLQQAPTASRHSRLRLRARTTQRCQRFEITANVGFLLGPRPALDAPLGGDRLVDSLVALRMHKRYRSPSECIALLKTPRMLADALINGAARDSRVIAPV